MRLNRIKPAFVIAAAAAFVIFASTFMGAQQQLADPRIVIQKRARTLKLYDGRKLVKTYKTALGFTPVGDKEVEGDGRTPEGDFYIFVKNDKSRYTLSLGLSYPDADDAQRGIRTNLITPAEEQAIITAVKNKAMPPQKTRLGGEIYIHGGGSEKDWTDGCIALSDNDITELFSLARTGMPVSIRP
jgi:murein L,D-transpeptidase YafK